MGAGTGRQTAAQCDAVSVRLEAALRRWIRLIARVMAVLSMVAVLLAGLLWSGFTIPDIYAVSPKGDVHRLEPLDR